MTTATPAKPKRKRPLYMPYEKCKHTTPCGEKCILSASYVHVYHACNRESCDYCHGGERFGRAAK